MPRQAPRFTIIGITGSMGMGKSTVAAMLAKHGYALFDADAETRALYTHNTPLQQKMARTFPEAHPGGDLDRIKLADLVFKDEIKRKKLESLVHPYIWRSMRDAICQAKNQGLPGIACDIPLLFETGADARCDYVFCVTAKASTQQARLLRRKGMTRQRIRSVLATQMPDREKRKRASFVIRTDTTRAETNRQVQQALTALQNKG